jgi:hypothetical protein
VSAAQPRCNASATRPTSLRCKRDTRGRLSTTDAAMSADYARTHVPVHVIQLGRQVAMTRGPAGGLVNSVVRSTVRRMTSSSGFRAHEPLQQALQHRRGGKTCSATTTRCRHHRHAVAVGSSSASCRHCFIAAASRVRSSLGTSTRSVAP